MASGGLHVIFGTAALGQATMRALLARGESVRLVSRSGQADVPATVAVVRGDASDVGSARSACAGAYAVYHCAAPAYTQWPTRQLPMLEGVIAGAMSAGARLIYPDNVYCYGRVADTMTETTPIAPVSRKGRVKVAMLERLQAAAQRGDVAVAIGRAPDFYGPCADATTVNGGRVFQPAIAGKPVSVLGRLDVPHTFISVDDFGRGLATLAEHDQALGATWHLPCPPPLTQRALLALIFQAAGHPPRVRTTPVWLLQALGLAVPIIREQVEMLYQWEEPCLFTHEAFDAAFGGDYTPHADAVAATVAWFRAHPQA